MKGLRKRILLDVFVTPWTILPFVGGASLLLLAEVAPVLAFFGFVGVLVSVGALTTNVVFNLDKISERAVKELMEKDQQNRNMELDRIAKRLSTDNDTRDERYLADLRALYGDFKQDVEAGKIAKVVTQDMLDQIDEIFNVCVHSLEQQFELLEMSQRVTGDIRKELAKQREDLLEEVGKNVAELAKLITQVRTFRMRANKTELADLRGSLSRSLQVAKQIEAFTSGQSVADQTIEKYAQYTKIPAKE